jgi:hypothetical protein
MPDRDEKGDDLADRMSRRFGGETETDEGTESTGTETTEDASGEPEGNVSDRPSVLMYLPEEQRRELDLRFDELNLKHKREHGEALQKNRDYYPAVIEAALSDRPLEEILLEE